MQSVVSEDISRVVFRLSNRNRDWINEYTLNFKTHQLTYFNTKYIETPVHCKIELKKIEVLAKYKTEMVYTMFIIP